MTLCLHQPAPARAIRHEWYAAGMPSPDKRSGPGRAAQEGAGYSVPAT